MRLPAHNNLSVLTKPTAFARGKSEDRAEAGRSTEGGSGRLPSGSFLPPLWLHEQAEKRQRALCLFKFLVEHERKGVMEASRMVARRFRGRRLKNRPSHRMALTPATVLRLYRHWQCNGETPAALLLRYAYGRRFIDGALLVRFIHFAADIPFPSFKAAWLAFCERGGNYGPGRIRGRKLVLKYDALRWNLPRGCFGQLQSEWKRISQAQRNIAVLRARFIAEISKRVPAKLPRRQVVNGRPA
jgi:hypothetical protein